MISLALFSILYIIFFLHYQLSDIVQRIDVTDDVPLCVSTVRIDYKLTFFTNHEGKDNVCTYLLFKEQVIYPQSAENKNNEWKYIANQDNFKQGIRVERCRCVSFTQFSMDFLRL